MEREDFRLACELYARDHRKGKKERGLGKSQSGDEEKEKGGHKEEETVDVKQWDEEKV
eukprot:CAMPEP_0114516874 /NCGR_PEP_ID=MMETSP0109-20121206/17576_1 /TAXON_ID=29199 /ORGANISM="Chlorarachnion reptans, Strain CCCM449" /LENGTH=57 /DNA_ID=CAMNT_0001697323 /DNA_START=1 /DNA_END=170 /DNA_ORIENTATION=-